MTDILTMNCAYRKRTGTGGSRAVRRDGWVPATLYGDDKPPANIKLPYNEVVKAYNTGRLISVLTRFKLDGEEFSAIGRDIQVDPVKDLPVHVDLMRVSAKTRLKVDVPVHFTNEDISPGLKAGGVLNVVRHTVEVNAPATTIPEYLEVDLAEAELGDTIHISVVTLPPGVESTITDRDFTIATIAAPSGLRSAEQQDSEDSTDTQESGEE